MIQKSKRPLLATGALYALLLYAFSGTLTCQTEDPGELHLEASQGEYSGYIQLKWDGISGATTYVLEKQAETESNSNEIYQGEQTSRKDSEVSPGINYEYRVTAYGSDFDPVSSNRAVGYAGE